MTRYKTMIWQIPLVMALTAVAFVMRLVRMVRRCARRRPRVMHGPTPMVGLVYRAAADRRFGYQSDVVVNTPGKWGYRYLEMSEFDHIIETSSDHLLFQRTKGLIHVMFHYDILVTFFDGSFFHVSQRILRTAEFWLLKLAGLKIISVSYGADIQYFDFLPAPRFDWINCYAKDYPKRNTPQHNLLVKNNIRRLNRVSDLVIAGGHDFAPMHAHDLNFKYYPIDCSVWKPLYDTGNQVPVIVHAPNHRHGKGTDLIIASCERLKQAGYQFDLQLVEGVARSEVMDIYRNADILLDQIIMGTHGITALEGLALGKPVLTYLNEDHLRDPSCNNGLVNTNPDNIDEVLKAIVSVAQLRHRMGIANRQNAEQFHSYDAMGEVWDRIYRHLWFGDDMDLQTTTFFSPTRQPRSLSEDPCDEEFWPVPVTDLIEEIRAAVAAPPTPSTTVNGLPIDSIHG